MVKDQLCALTELAACDGQIDESEKNLIISLGEANGIEKEEIVEILEKQTDYYHLDQLSELVEGDAEEPNAFSLASGDLFLLSLYDVGENVEFVAHHRLAEADIRGELVVGFHPFGDVGLALFGLFAVVDVLVVLE